MKIKVFILLSLILSTLNGQSKRDPRVVAMAGAYTTIAEGAFCVGYNPGAIGLQQNKPLTIQAFGLDVGILGNFFSIENIASYSGDTLSRSDKDAMFDELNRTNGLSFFVDSHMPLPFLNISKGNIAFSANNVILQNYRLPIGILELFFYGNEAKPKLNLDLNYEIAGLNEYGFSFGIPFKNLSWGVTAKYLQGLFYLGIDDDSTEAYLKTEDIGIFGKGDFLIRQGVGGSGFALDVGVVSRPNSGWKFGVSMINIIGTITWNKSGGTDERKSLNPLTSKFYPFAFGGDTLDLNESIRYTFNIDTIRADKLGNDSLFTTETIFFVDTLKDGSRPVFETRYPATFRMGVSKEMDKVIFASDLVAGFENKYYAQKLWKWSLGVEWRQVPMVPMRLGFAWGGSGNQELGMGFGVKKGPVMFDFGFAFRNGIWLNTMKGFNFSIGATFIGREKNIESEENNLKGPLPKK
ncbi:MAG: DUF5723 family protein [Candidatus Neomarinimicrobiota bacterium]